MKQFIGQEKNYCNAKYLVIAILTINHESSIISILKY